MFRKLLVSAASTASLLLCLPAMAQYMATPNPGEPPATPQSQGTRAGGLKVIPQKGQSEQQQWTDRYDCHRWARSQSGFDPTQPPDRMSQADSAMHRDQYERALSACLEGKGYEVQVGPSTYTEPAAAPPPPAMNESRLSYEEPKSHYRPLSFRIGGGFAGTVGNTDRYLNDGGTVNFGLTWYPTSLIPLALRVDGVYSSFRARHRLVDSLGFEPGYVHGRENIYGGDVDLQYDVFKPTANMKLYVFGGAGWYREQISLNDFSDYGYGYDCDFYDYCGGGYYYGDTYRTTSSWHSSWNAGLGWEMSFSERASLFVEARYWRIAPQRANTQFVPVTVGIRF